MWSDIKRKYKIALGIQRRDIAKLCSFRGRGENMLEKISQVLWICENFSRILRARDEIKWSSKGHKALNDVLC